jgi:hypothetical protein
LRRHLAHQIMKPLVSDLAFSEDAGGVSPALCYYLLTIINAIALLTKFHE